MTDKNNILILGGAGFIGANLINHLLESDPECIIYSIGRGSLVNRPRLTHYCLDITFDNICTVMLKNGISQFRIDTVYNCSGTSSVGEAQKDPARDLTKTMIPLFACLEYLTRYNPEAVFIQMSTAAVYGNAKGLPIPVDQKIAPISVYGNSNALAETTLEMYSRVFGLRVAICRLFSVYGAGLKKQILWDACCKFSQGKREFFGSGRELRDFIHISDVVLMLSNIRSVVLANDKNRFELFNVGSGIAVSIFELLHIVSKQFNVGLEPTFSGEEKVGDPVGFQAMVDKSLLIPKIDLATGVSQYVAWFLSLEFQV